MPDEPCEVCGPGPVHVLCHPVLGLRRNGCGHLLADHTAGLRCRVCKKECGIDCTPLPRRVAKQPMQQRLDL